MYALLGATLKHSLSPEIHRLIFREFGMDGQYILLECKSEELKETIISRKCKGFNVTIPYKQEVIQYLDELSDEAKQIGAVNTIKYSDGKIVGYNTDYFGFASMLEINGIEVCGKNIVVLGLGGSTKTVVSYMLNNNAKSIYVVSRSPENKPTIAGTNLISYEQLKALNNLDIVINTTPSGMYPNVDVSPIQHDLVKKFHTAVDLIYNPAQTLFLQYAQQSNLKYVNGLQMLVAQAVYAQEIWQEKKLSEDSIKKISREIGARYEA